MRNKIEIDDQTSGEPTFIRVSRAADLKGHARPSTGADQLARSTTGRRAGGILEPALRERTENPLKMVFLARVDRGGNDKHASACRGLIEALSSRGHRVLVLEGEAKERKSTQPPRSAHTLFYESVKQLKERFTPAIRHADFVVIASNVSDSRAIGEWVTHVAQGATAFYDLNTPATLASLSEGESEHLSPSLISRYDLYLSFTGGPLLELVKNYYGSPMVRPLFGSVDTSVYYPETAKKKWDLAYSGDCNEERMPGLDELLFEPARDWPTGRFTLAGRGFPMTSEWPRNLKRLAPVAAGKERSFYNANRFFLNVTGADMIEAGLSPSLRIFEAAACGTPIISDYWEDLEAFFAPHEEILFARSSEEMLDYLRGIGEHERLRIGDNARRRVLAEHSTDQRALELENFALELFRV